MFYGSFLAACIQKNGIFYMALVRWKTRKLVILPWDDPRAESCGCVLTKLLALHTTAGIVFHAVFDTVAL